MRCLWIATTLLFLFTVNALARDSRPSDFAYRDPPANRGNGRTVPMQPALTSVSHGNDGRPGRHMRFQQSR